MCLLANIDLHVAIGYIFHVMCLSCGLVNHTLIDCMCVPGDDDYNFIYRFSEKLIEERIAQEQNKHEEELQR